jgi:hypothetical protein
VQLRRDGIGCDILVVRRKGISRETEGTYPQAGSNIDLAAEDTLGVSS